MKLSALLTYLFFCFSYSSTAQLCSGSLGDPAFNETFGEGHYQLAPNKTSYQFVNGCPDNQGGTYTLSSFLFGCGPHSWVQMVGDHTGDSKGNYMLVNAASTPGTVYMDTAKNLCGNTNYQFGVWFTSVMTKFACNGSPILPNLKFQIKTLSGTVLIEGNSGFLPIVDQREWKFYSLSFQTPGNVDAVIISITIDPTFGCGSVFAIDDITVRPCSPSIISATINGTPGPVDVCSDYAGTWTLSASYTPGFTNPVFQWQSSVDTGATWVDIPGQTSLNYTAPHRTSGTILYRMCIAENGNINSLNCRIISNVIYTGVHPMPLPDTPQTVVGCIGKNFNFPPADQYTLQALWQGPNGYSSTALIATIPNIQSGDTGLYTLKKTYYFGCVLLDTFYLKVFQGTTISVQPSYPICNGTSEQLFASASDSVSFQWIPSKGLSNSNIPDPVASPSDSTVYKILVTNKYGCKDSALLTVNVYKRPTTYAGTSRAINLGDTITLNGSVTGTSIDYQWSPSSFIDNIHSSTPRVYPHEDEEYTITANSEVGCGSSSSTVLIRVYKDVYVPNAFTPNNDGKNDVFRILAADNNKQFKLLVYNRWGQLVYETTDISKGWDGEFKNIPQPSDVYIYYLEIQTASNKKITKKGTVTLIR